MKKIKLSIILPCYNEGNKLDNSVSQIVEYLKNIKISSYEILIVNDGSTDYTLNYIIDLKEKYPNILRVIHYKNNHGKGYAVKKGISEAIGEYIIFMDVDLSTDLSAIDKCMKIINKENTPIIIGSRRLKESELTKSQNGLRKFIGNCCSYYTNMKLNLHIKDTQCGFKCFEKTIAKKLIKKQTIERWAFDAELLFIAKLNNIEIKEIPIKWTNDEDSKVSPLKASFNFISDLRKIKKNKKKYIQ